MSIANKFLSDPYKCQQYNCAKSNLDFQIRPMCPSYSKETELNTNFKHYVMRYFVSTLGKYWKNFKTGRKLRFQPSKIQTAPKIGN